MDNKNNLPVASKLKKRKKFIVVISLLLSLISLFFCIAMGVKYIEEKNKQTFSFQKNAQEKILTTADTISAFIKILKNITLPLSKKLEEGKISKKEVENILAQKPVEISSFGVKFNHKFSPSGRYWAPCFSQINRTEILEDLALSSSGTVNSEPDWQREMLAHDTFSTKIGEDKRIEYSRVFYHKNLKTGELLPAGTIFATQDRKHFRHLLTTLFYGQAGYWFIVEKKNGIILDYPKKFYEDNKTTLGDLAEQKNTPELKVLFERIQNEETGYLKYNNELIGAQSWLYFRSIPLTDWVLCGVFDRSDLVIAPEQEKRNITNLFLLFMCFILFLVGAFILNNKATVRNLWFISLLFSFACIVVIAIVWHITILYPITKETGHLIRDKIDLYKKIEEVKEKGSHFQRFSSEEKKENILNGDNKGKEILSKTLLKYLNFHYHAKNNNEPNNVKPYEYMIISTGIFINHINYIRQNQLEVGFFVWQRYIKSVHDKIKHDILFPKAAGAEIKLISIREINGVEVILWEVKCILDQISDITNYPFDINAIRFKIWPSEFDKKIILVPDFNAYNVVSPTFLPGLAHKTFLAGFNPIKSFFSYRDGTYNTNFGIYSYGKFGMYDQLDKASIPELYFNIIPQRQVLDIIINDLAPIILIAFFIFYLFMTIGTHSYTMFGSSATVFFGLLLAHMRFRSKLPSTQFVYFDCFYIILYAMILLFTIFSMLNLGREKGLQLKNIHHKKNLILQLLYWPLVLGSILYFTLFYLY